MKLVKRSEWTFQELVVVNTLVSTEFLKENEILFCAVLDRKVVIKLLDGQTTTVKHSLKELTAMLDPLHFYRCHSKYIVNLHCLKRYYHKTGELVMIDGSTLRVSKDRKTVFYRNIGHGKERAAQSTNQKK